MTWILGIITCLVKIARSVPQPGKEGRGEEEKESGNKNNHVEGRFGGARSFLRTPVNL
jgi:hypothetical protein